MMVMAMKDTEESFSGATDERPVGKGASSEMGIAISRIPALCPFGQLSVSARVYLYAS